MDRFEFHTLGLPEISMPRVGYGAGDTILSILKTIGSVLLFILSLPFVAVGWILKTVFTVFFPWFFTEFLPEALDTIWDAICAIFGFLVEAIMWLVDVMLETLRIFSGSKSGDKK